MRHKNWWICSKKILTIPFLDGLLNVRACKYYAHQAILINDEFIGWGFKPTANRARQLAKNYNLPYLALEDGFLRSLGLGISGYPPLSLVVDDLGIYYNAPSPSRLEELVKAVDREALPVELEDAQRAITLLCRHRLSKYNHAPDFSGPTSWDSTAILVIDQTFGDMSVKLGGADQATFEHMLDTALAENPSKTIWIKTHPDVMCGKKQGYLTNIAADRKRIKLLPLDVNPMSLLPHVGKVYVVTSQMGFEALLCGKPVVTFGLPWYAGWGLTDDRHPKANEIANRRGNASLETLFAGAYLRYCRYLNPQTGERGTIFDVIHHLAQVKQFNEALRGELVCVGMSLWKRAVVTPFLRLPATRLRFVRSVAALKRLPSSNNRRVLLWGAGKFEVKQAAESLGLPVVQMEDGFIRSIGLGSNLVPPLSLVIDDLGIYFDPNNPSRLESLLASRQFSQNDLEEAQALRLALINNRIGKYNVGVGEFALPSPRPNQIILVPGQVEDDASIRTGSPWVKSNLQLLQAVRKANPQAFIVYKPHPDVVSGNRKGYITESQVNQWADAYIPEADILACLALVDEVHTMTSLTGFEALLRKKKVVCYGVPFYAGWGLTTDVYADQPLDAWQRRNIQLTLDELVVGTLIKYPRYLDPKSQSFISAIRAVELLQEQKNQKQASLKRGWHKQQWGKVNMLWKCLTRKNI